MKIMYLNCLQHNKSSTKILLFLVFVLFFFSGSCDRFLFKLKYSLHGASLVAHLGKNPPSMQETLV